MDISSYFTPAQAFPQSQGIVARFFGPLVALVPVLTGLAAFVFILLAGLRYLTHAGNAAEVKKSTDMLTYAVIGLAVSAVAFWLTRLLFQVGGAEGLF